MKDKIVLPEQANIDVNDEKTLLTLGGDWRLSGITDLSVHYHQIEWPTDKAMTIDGSKVISMDSAGALLLEQCGHKLKTLNNTIKYINFQKTHQEMLALVDKELVVIEKDESVEEEKKPFLYRVGKDSCKRGQEALNFLSLMGEVWLYFIQGFRHFRVFHIPNIASSIYHTGYRALPILGLLSFLIGVVLAYQMGLQLKTYGANIFIVYLTGVAVLREFGPLIAAIIVAGRTSSAFTAEIGTMKVSQEIDALMTMGISPVQRLVLPKVLGLIIVFPLLIFWSDLFGIFGAMVMSKIMLGIGFPDFIARLKADVGVSHYYIGISKAPFFAAIIALVGCYQGFQVSSSADSVGFQTTKSVVQAIFLIIIADAFFSVLYSWAGL
jgi:phospholipid/cholesterol/gamma-HCH transport system permease protein